MRNFFIKYGLSFLKLLFKKSYETRNTAAPIKFIPMLKQKMSFSTNRYAYWPVHKNSLISGAQYIKIGVGTAPGLSFGCYIFANEESPITIGDYTIIAPNVTLAGFSHSAYDFREYVTKSGIKIGSYCWIAANSTILPGVTLGDHVVVGANSVVTKSFPDGACIIAGNPAVMIKKLDLNILVKYKNKYEYIGFMQKNKFYKFREKKLKV